MSIVLEEELLAVLIDAVNAVENNFRLWTNFLVDVLVLAISLTE